MLTGETIEKNSQIQDRTQILDLRVLKRSYFWDIVNSAIMKKRKSLVNKA